MICAIMQPTYLPWLGYFDLMAQADVFVLLDHVQFSRRSWQQRNRIKTPAGLAWLTVPVANKGRYGQAINEVRIEDPGFAARHLATVRLNYAAAAHFQTYFPAFEETLLEAREPGMLAPLNTAMLGWLSRLLGITNRLLRSSDLGVVGNRTDLLVNVCRAVGADTYLSPIGSLDYLRHEHAAFDAAGIRLRFQDFAHPTYTQLHGDFVPYASALDALLNVGEETVDLVAAGRRPNLTLGEALAVHPLDLGVGDASPRAALGGQG